MRCVPPVLVRLRLTQAASNPDCVKSTFEVISSARPTSPADVSSSSDSFTYVSILLIAITAAIMSASVELTLRKASESLIREKKRIEGSPEGGTKGGREDGNEDE